MPTHPPSADDVLFTAWTHQLYREYNNILFQHNVTLNAPLIRILPMKGKWAFWDGLTRTIALNPELIRLHGWDVTVEILKHEMAHQLAQDRFGATGGHGRPFELACKLLGVEDWATAASGELPTCISRPSERTLTDEEEKLLRRVEKLLSLATSSNEHEALLAMQRVQELYARHNFLNLQSEKTSHWLQLTIRLDRKRIEKHTSMICSILIGHFFVRVVTRKAFDPLKLDSYSALDLIGTRENVKMAEYVYHFLLNQTASLYEQKKHTLPATRSAKGDFTLGVLDGFRRKLAEGSQEVLKRATEGITPKDQKALIRRGEQELELFMERRHPRLTERKANFIYHDPSAFKSGQTEGRRLVLHKGVSGEGKGGGGLLGSG
ncbi:MAG: SprT-like domain-containing protein [Myxococcota bacterium]